MLGDLEEQQEVHHAWRGGTGVEVAGDGAGGGRNRGPTRTSPRLSEDLELGGKSTAGAGSLNQGSDGPDSHFEVLVALGGHCSGVGSHRGELQKFR